MRLEPHLFYPNKTEQMCWLPKNYNTPEVTLSRKKLHKFLTFLISQFVQLFSKKVLTDFNLFDIL
jgi:hypothetical protein